MYRRESQNVKSRHFCRLPADYLETNLRGSRNNYIIPNNQEECEVSKQMIDVGYIYRFVFVLLMIMYTETTVSVLLYRAYYFVFVDVHVSAFYLHFKPCLYSNGLGTFLRLTSNMMQPTGRRLNPVVFYLNRTVLSHYGAETITLVTVLEVFLTTTTGQSPIPHMRTVY